jgi:FSR family fosmidomycin resistance protein-like MFS transporter
VFGTREAAWPLIRDDLALDYTQIGILLGLPNVISSVIEPFLGILGDVWRRRVLILGGGIVYGIALLLTAFSGQFIVLLAAFILMYPASGAFVSLSQATLMDLDPARHEHNMARWTFAGSVGVVGGTLLVSAASAMDTSWRVLFLLMAGLAFALVALAWRHRFQPATDDRPPTTGDYGTTGNEKGESEKPTGSPLTFKEGLANGVRALKRPEVLRWLTLLEFSDLMLDVLLGYLALYFVDVAGASPETAALGVTIWTAVGLLGDFLLIPLLERVRGLSYLRVSVVLELVLMPAFLLVPDLWAKFVLIGLLGLFNSGWYAILQGRLYSAMPGQSGIVMAVKNVSGLVGGLLPVAIGLAAEAYGLGPTMWLLMLGPIALLVGLPRGRQDHEG